MRLVRLLLLCAFTAVIAGCGGSDQKVEKPETRAKPPGMDAAKSGRGGGESEKAPGESAGTPQGL